MTDNRSERDAVVRKLEQQRRGYAQLLMRLPVAVLVVAKDTIRFANHAAAQLLAAESTRQLKGVRYDQFVRSATPFAPEGGERLELRRLDGQIVEVIAAIDVSSRSKRIVLREVSLADATDEEIRQSQRMEALGRLASGIAHDFNNLLTAIHGHAQFLLEDMPEAQPSRSDAQEIMRSTERAAALTRQLLTFSRGKTAQAQSIDLNHIIVAMEALLRRVITENIVLVTNLETSLGSVHADATQIEQILVNLVVNARDAMPDGGTITIKTSNAELQDVYSTTHEEVEPGNYVMLVVSDTGSGMTKDVQEHVFEPFFTTKAPGKGTGLGLSTVYSIVRELGGHVFVYSEAGHGTVFKIYLPAVLTETVRPAQTAVDKQVAPGSETILIVEDDIAVRALATRVLEAHGHKVLVAASGHEAMQIVSDTRAAIAVVLTDHILPDTTGAALGALIWQRLPDCQLIIMSGYTAEDVQRIGTVPAGAEFMEKPFVPAELVRKVRAALDAAVT